jgi:hypothetical protein
MNVVIFNQSEGHFDIKKSQRFYNESGNVTCLPEKLFELFLTVEQKPAYPKQHRNMLSRGDIHVMRDYELTLITWG